MQVENNDDRITFSLIGAVLATALMSFCGVASETAMNVVFPSLMEEFSIGTGTVQWLTTGYLLMLALVIPLSSFLKRRFTTRTLFLAAIGLFITGTLCCCFAPHFSLLLCGRLLQGAGTGVALPLMYNIILAQAPRNRLGLMMGLAAMISSLAPALGPVMGGVMSNAFGWRSIFLLLMPILAVSALLGTACIRPFGGTERTRFDVAGYILLAIAFTAFIFATERVSEYGWTSPVVLVLVATAAGLLALFTYRSLGADDALVDLRVFRHATFRLALIYLLLLQFGVLATSFLLPNVAQLALGENALVAGFLMLPATLVGAVVSPISGRLLDRLGAAGPILTGGLCIVAAFVLFALFSRHLSVGTIIALTILCFLGLGLSLGNTLTLGLASLPGTESADGNAVINTLQQLAGAVGTSMSAVLVANAQAATDDLVQGTLDGAQHTFVLLAALALIALSSISLALKRPQKKG